MTQSSNPDPEILLSPADVEAITRAIADPRRFAMMQQIARGATMACSELAMKECLSPATISHHLKELQTAGLLEMSREGRGLHLVFRRAVWQAYLRQLGEL